MLLSISNISITINIFDPAVLNDFFKEHYFMFLILIFLGACLLTYYLIPKIIWISKAKKLMKPITARCSHNCETPAFGGVAFFMTLMLVLCTLQGLQLGKMESNLIAALTILFMVGIKDDLMVSSPQVKLFGQLAASSLIILAPQMQFTNLYGFLGIHEVPELLGYVLSTFLMIALINAYNLIDGINGLAGIIGIIVCSCYGLFFYLVNEPYFVTLAFVVVGVLLAFLRFNFSAGKNKIFMGDSGSLIIGLMIGFLSLKILTLPFDISHLDQGYYLLKHRYVFLFSILFIPIFDTTRVMAIRILKGKSPFVADRNHIHHILLDLGFKHYQASVFLGVINLFVFFFFLMAKNQFSAQTMILFIIGLFIVTFITFEILSKLRHKPKKQFPEENLDKKPSVFIYDMNE